MPAPGDIVDRYVVEHLLGEGGAASVWAVRHRVLGTRHAIKILRGNAAELGPRLIREGQLQARLDPAHIVPVTDVIEVHGQPALVLPLIEGGTLAQAAGAGPLPTAEVAAVAAAIARGLGSAHAAGVVHRDLKPANVLLDTRPDRVVPRISDFGLARMLDQVGPTRQGVYLGSPAWSPPEQLHGGAIGAAADLWSLGVVVFQLLTGRFPFEGDDLPGLRRAQEHGFDREILPPAWRSLVARLLDPDPAARPAALDLEPVLLQLGAGTDALGEGSELLERVRSRPTSGTPGLPPVPDRDTGRTLALDEEPPAALPAERDPFVGRADTLAELERLLVGEARLVTLLGIGGAGKTRVALRFARTRAERFPGGTWFVDLSSATDLQGLARAVIAGLGLSLQADTNALDAAEVALRRRGRALFVLDNFEQLVALAPVSVGRWLDTLPEARFLATSREALAVRGEVWLPLDPLGRDDARDLFLRRAASVRPASAAQEVDQPALDELVALLDGLPLAIELAAARTAVLSIRHLRDRMVDRFRLLASSGDRPTRQATMRAALDGSWELLPEAERAGLAQLSVFEATFTFEAATAVLDVGAWPEDVVQGLVSRSLLRRDRDRFGMLVTVQQYAAERLVERGADEVRGAQLRHAAWFGQRTDTDAVADVPDLIAATRRSLALDRALADRCASRLWRVAQKRGPVGLARELLHAALAIDPAAASAALLHAGAMAAESAGDLEEAETLMLRAMERAAGAQTYDLIIDRAALWAGAGRFEDAIGLLVGALPATDPMQLARARGNLGVYHAHLGRLEDARRWLEQAADDARLLPGQTRGALLMNLAAVTPVDQPDRIRELLHRARDAFREVAAVHNEALVCTNLGLLALAGGDLDEARAQTNEAVDLADRVGEPYIRGLTRVDRGTVWLALGELAAARADAASGEELTRAGSDQVALGKALSLKAQVQAASGQLESARSTLSELDGLADRLGGGPESMVGQELALARAMVEAASG